MPSARSVFKMKAAIEWCCREYPGLPKILRVQKLPEEWIYETMAKWDVSKRTAMEYLRVASYKIKALQKEEEIIRENDSPDKVFQDALDHKEAVPESQQ